MPYRSGRGGFERASRLGHVPTAKDPAIAEELATYHVPAVEGNPTEVESRRIPVHEVQGPDTPAVRFAIALDGSSQEVPVRDEFPSIRVGYLQVAGVLVDLDQMLVGGLERFIDPTLIKRTTARGLLTAALPSSNLFTRTGVSAATSWREAIFKLFNNKRVESRSLLDILVAIWNDPGSSRDHVTLKRCPLRDENGCTHEDLQVHVGSSTCPGCGSVVYPTDILRIAEEVQDGRPNLTSLTRLGSSIEVTSFMGYLMEIWANDPASLGITAFVADGPLALFGPTAPMKTRVLQHLQAINSDLVERGLALPVVVGLEKSGLFVEHAQTVSGFLEPGTLMTLDSTYIDQRVRGGFISSTPYGRDEFFGRRFFYRTNDGRTMCLSVPPIQGSPYGDSPTEDITHYPTLRRTLNLLDRIGTRLYENAVIPVALAHSYAALPLGTGSDVLRVLAQRSLGLAPSASKARPVY